MQVDGYRVRSLTAEDAPTVQALLALDPTYFERTESAPMRPDDGLEIILERPPGVPPERKHNFLLEAPAPGASEPAAVALLSLLEGYPDEHTWYLGQLFVAPAARGHGLGTRALEALSSHARARGARALRLAVTTTNAGARRLYDRLGFAFVTRRARTSWAGTAYEVDILERAL